MQRPLKRAFTLIELLVVIAIIAILAAILFPVFAQAKNAAKKTVDMSNMKNLALAGELWKADHDGYLIQAGYNNASHGEVTGISYYHRNWDCAIQPYLKSKDIFTSPLASDLPKHGAETTAATEDYACPEWDAGRAYCKGDNWTNIGPMGAAAADDDIGSGYRLNSSNQPGYSAADPSIHFRTSLNESSVDQLSSMILIVPGGKGTLPNQKVPYHETTTADAGYADAVVCVDTVAALANVDYDRNSRGPKNPTKAQINQGRANYGFGDGHAASLSWRATWKRLGEDTKDSAGNVVTPTPWRQVFQGAPDACKYREGDGR